MVGILTDITKCVGCRKCVSACQSENRCAPEMPMQKAFPEKLFHTRWTSVLQKMDQKSQPRFVRKHCRHCLHPSCVSVCPVGALKITKEGHVLYDKGICLGCRYCLLACPYGIPRYEWNSRIPAVTKCTLCFSRIAEGKEPACTEACPEKATIFGKRDDLIQEAKKRIRDNPDRYIDKVYGEHELGGTSVLYISDIELDFLGLDGNFSEKPMPELTWNILKQTPAIAGVMGVSMSFFYWFTRRKRTVVKTEKKKTAKK